MLIDRDPKTGDVVKPEPVLNPRDAAMAEIAIAAQDRRDADLIADETGLSTLHDDPEIVPDADPELTLGVENVEKVDIELNEVNTSVVTEHDGIQYLNVVVNGEAKEIKLSDAIATLQQGGNADYQTKLAVEEKNLYTAKLQELEVKQAEAVSRSTQPDDAETSNAETRDVILSAAHKLYDDGDVEGFTDGLTELISKRSAPAPTAPAVDEGAMNQLLDQREQRKALGDAYKSFSDTERFKPLVEDEDLLMLVDRQTQRLQSDSEFMAASPSYGDIFEKAGELVLEKVGLTVVPPTDPVLEKKRMQPRAVPSRTVRRSSPTPKKPPTKSDTISKIAAARGQLGYQ